MSLTIFAAVAGSVALWIALSTAQIIFNASLLQGFRHPIALICWHMLIGSTLIGCVRAVRPILLRTGDPERGIPSLTMWRAFQLGAPVAFVHSVSMIFGNAAYLHLTVSFIQMIKAWTTACVYLVGCQLGTQTWSLPVAKTIAVITFGLTVASYGEIGFNAWGFFLCVASISLEGFRINLLEIRLKANGYKLNPLSSLQIFAPLMLVILVPCVLVWDLDALKPEELQAVGFKVLLANALTAFCLNISVFLVIQRASGLIFALGGVLKDVLIIFGSFLFLGSRLTMTQLCGYCVALAGLQIYGIVSKEPGFFQENGLLPGLLERSGARGIVLKDSPRQQTVTISDVATISPTSPETDIELANFPDATTERSLACAVDNRRDKTQRLMPSADKVGTTCGA